MTANQLHISTSLLQELLYNKHTNINGSKIESTGFQYEVPNMTVDLLKEVGVVT